MLISWIAVLAVLVLPSGAQAPANSPALRQLQNAAPAPFELEKAPEPEGQPEDFPAFQIPGLQPHEISELYRVSAIIDQHGLSPVESKQLFYGALRGMLKTLDEHSKFLDPQEMAELKRSLTGVAGGLGIATEKEPGRPERIIKVYAGEAAEAADLKVGDLILEVDGKDILPMTANETTELVVGLAGTPVTLKIRRLGSDGQERELIVNIVRGVIRLANVWVNPQLLSGKTGYIYMKSFRADSAKEIREGIRTLRAQGAQSLILDLRENLGGDLDAAIKIAGMFLRKGQVATRLAGRDVEEALAELQRDGEFAGLPLKILVNGFSASASEIVAGAIQDNKRGLVVGSRTYGKGTAQELFVLADGSGILLTHRQWLTPNSRAIEKSSGDAGGITPDIAVSVSREQERKILVAVLHRLHDVPAGEEIEDPALQAALRAR